MTDPRADLFALQLLEPFRPKDEQTPLAWMEEHCRFLPGPIGSFHAIHSPWLVGPINAVFDPETRMVVNLAAIGSGKSVFVAVVIAYILGKAPADVIVYQPTNDNAKGFFRETLKPVWEGCPPVASLMPSGKDVTWKHQRIGTSQVWTLGADAESNLQRYHVKWVFIDEAWQVANNKGYIRQAKARTMSYGFLSKVVLTGQGGTEGDDYQQEWLQTTQEEYHWKCPHCSHIQPWSWDTIKLPEGGLTADGVNEGLIARETKMACAGCGHLFDDSDQVRHDLNQTSLALPGHGYVRMNHNARDAFRGFHWNCLPARPWGEAAIDWAKAKLAQTNGDETPMQIFMTKQLAHFHSSQIMDSTDEVAPGSFKLRDPWDDEAGFDISTRSIVPIFTPGDTVCRLRFAGIDCQRDGFFIVIRAYSADGRSRLIDWGFFHTIDEVDGFRKKHEVVAPFTFIDSGDQQDFVHRVAAKMGWQCTRGHRKNEYPWPTKMPDGTLKVKARPYSKPREIEPFKGMVTKVYYFGNLPFKDLLWRLRRSGVHQFPLDAGEEYRKQMAAERRTKTAAGIPIWKCPKGRANHLWDCETLLMLPALVFGLAGESKVTEGKMTEPPPEPPTAEDDGEAVD